MPNPSYIYSFNYDYHHTELCKLESRQIFDEVVRDKLLFSNIKVDPSISSFIKNRFEISISADSYSRLLDKLKEENICCQGFKAEYMLLEGDPTEYTERLKKLKDIGTLIEGKPDVQNPSIIYSLCNSNDIWYFGVLVKRNTDWRKHKNKPYSFSNSLCIHIAKTLASVASKGNKTTKLLDACCGVGTVLLEACYAGLSIEGCDINLKSIKHTKQNLEHYKYTSNVYCMDIKDLTQKYDAAIIDLPYNLYSYSDDVITSNIIESTVKLSSRIVIVSKSDIEAVIKKSGLKIIDFCTVEKRGRSTFTRSIWVCEKEVL
jgi:tRNA (guanine10-N2)-dimethyltransferase